MSLFSNPASELDNLLDAMQLSSLNAIDDILRGDHSSDRVDLDSRMTKAAGLVSKLIAKGKREVAVSLLTDWRAKEVQRSLLFSAEPGASFEQARARAQAEIANLPPDPDQEKKDANWRKIIDDIARRAGLADSLSAPA